MKQWKKLAALILAGVVVLTALTGCDGSKAAVNGKNIVENYHAFYEKWPIEERGPGVYDESMDAAAGKALDMIADTVASGATDWGHVLDGYLADSSMGFTEAGRELGSLILGTPAPQNYKITIALAEVPSEGKDSPAMIAYALYDPLELGWVRYTRGTADPEAKYKTGAAVKTVGDNTYALLIGLFIDAERS